MIPELHNELVYWARSVLTLVEPRDGVRDADLFNYPIASIMSP